jgi:YidC/Oxa1 family membrane protein insertase
LNIWELIIQQPLTNVLIVMSHYLGGSFGAAVIVLTIVINLILLPMTLSQIRSSKKMQDLQPKLQDIQKKYAKDKQKLAEEQMKLYKTAGIKPVGCMVGMFIQMPVWIALYQSIMLALAASPEGLLGLSRFLYPWDVVYNALPLSQYFLGMNLASPNPILAVLVGVAMWVQQKMSSTPNSDPRQQQQATMMLWMMPLLFTFMALSFNAGLAIYWVASSLFRIVLQYRISGWGGLKKQPPPPTAEAEKKRLEFKDVTPRKSVEEENKENNIITDKESLRKITGGKKSSIFDIFRNRDDRNNQK